MQWLKDSRFMNYMEKLNRNEYVEEKKLTTHPGRILIFLAMPPVGLGPRTLVP